MFKFQQFQKQNNQSSKTDSDSYLSKSETNYFNNKSQDNQQDLKNANLLKSKEIQISSIKQYEKGEFQQYSILENPNQRFELNYQSLQLKMPQQIYDVEEQCSLQVTNRQNNLKSLYQLNNNQFNFEQKNLPQIQQNQIQIDQESQINEFQQYEQIQLFNNEYTRVTIQYNEQIKQLTIKKHFKKNDILQFQKEIQIIKLFEKEKITLPLVQCSEINELWYEQIAGSKDFLIIQQQYQDNDKRNYLDYRQYLSTIIQLFCKLFEKLDRIFKLGYAHSDIKPQNFVIGFDCEPYFIDFGGSVELDDFQNYLNQFTPFYNHEKYCEKKEGCDSYKIHPFLNKTEIQQCDRIQLALSFLYMIALDFQDYKKQQKDKKIILSMYKYFKDKNYDQIMNYNIDDDFYFLQAILTNCDDLKFLDQISLKILQLIEEPDYYEKIKDTIHQISYNQQINSYKVQNINQFQDTFFEKISLRSINQYNANLINVYLNTHNLLKININNHLQISQYLQKNIVIQSISRIVNDQINQEAKINLQIQKNPNSGKFHYKISSEFVYNKRCFNQFERCKLYKDCFGDLIEQFKNSKTLSDRSQIQQQISEFVISLKEGKFLNILDECQVLQDKILDQLICDIKNINNHICSVFNHNKFIIEIYNEDFVNDKFLQEIQSYSDKKNEFEIVFIDCRFKNDFFTLLDKFNKSYSKYKISYLTKYQNVQSTSMKCQSVSSYINYKDQIKLLFVNRKYEYIGTNNFDFFLKQQKENNTFINSSPFCVVLSDKESGYFQQLLKNKLIFIKNPQKKSFFRIKNEHQDNNVYDPNQKFQFYQKAIITDEDSFYKYLNGQKSSYLIVEINDIKFLVSVSLQKQLENYFINFDVDASKFISDDVLIISMLGHKKYIDQEKFEKINEEKDKMRKSLFSAENIKINYPQNLSSDEQNQYDEVLKKISEKYKFCQDVNEIFDYYVSQFSKVNSYEKYTIDQFKKDYHDLKLEFQQASPQLQQYEISIDKKKQVHFYQYFEKKFNPLFIADDLMDWFKLYQDDFEKNLYNKFRSQLSNMINGEQSKQLKA